MGNHLFGQSSGLELHKKISTNKNFRKGVLSNGFTYYLERDKNAEERLSIHFVVRVGEEHETNKQVEVAHVLEHLAFNGTVTFPDVRFFLDSHRLVLGKDCTASTGAKTTRYRFSIPNNDRILFLNCLDLIKDWANQGIILDNAKISAEKGSVMQEIARKDGEFSRNYGDFYAKIIGADNHNGRILVDSRIGLRNLDYSEVGRFYNHWYVPKFEALIISGDYDVDSVEQVVRSVFANLKIDGGAKVDLKYTVPRKLTGDNGIYFISKTHGDDIECKIAFKSKYVPVITYNDLRINVLRMLLANLIESRCNAAGHMQSDQGYNVDYSPEASGYGRVFSSTILSFRCDSGQIKKKYLFTMKEMFRIKKKGFLKEEIESAKASVRGNLVSHYRAEKGIGINEYIGNFTRSEIIPDHEEILSSIELIFSQLDLGDVAEALAMWDPIKNVDVVFFTPSRYSGGLISIGEVRKWNFEANKGPIEPFDLIKEYPIEKSIVGEKKRYASLMTDAEISSLDDSFPENAIDSVKSMDVVVVTLQNGIRVTLKSGDFDGGEVYVYGAKRGNAFVGDRTDSVLTKYCSYLVFNSGLGRLTPDDWLAFQDERQMKLTSDIGPDGVLMSGRSKKAKLEDLLQSIRFLIVAPLIDSGFFSRWKDMKFKEINTHRNISDPTSAYVDALSREFDFSRNLLQDTKDLDCLKLNEALLRYKDIYSNDGKYEFFVSGKFDVDSVLFLLNRYIGTIPVVPVKSRVWSARIANSAKVSKLRVFDGKGLGTSRVDILFPSINPVTPYSDVLMKVLRDEFGRLVVARLRVKEGVSYSPRANTVKLWNNHYFLSIYFDCSSDRIADAVRFVKEELANLKDIDVQNRILESSKKVVMSTIKDRQVDPLFWIEWLSGCFLNGLDVCQVDSSDLDSQITSRSVINAANSFFGDSSIVFILQATESSMN
jgi:zinc protease